MKKLLTIVVKICCCISLFLLGGCGDKYSEQGNKLSISITNELVKLGFCSTPTDCIKKLDIYGGHDNRVNFEIYNAKDRKMLASFIEFAVDNGLKITNGIPIAIKVYPKLRSEYGNRLVKDRPIIDVIILQ